MIFVHAPLLNSLYHKPVLAVTSKRRSSRFWDFRKIEDLPDEQEDKRSIISKINKKAKQLVYEEINCE